MTCMFPIYTSESILDVRMCVSCMAQNMFMWGLVLCQLLICYSLSWIVIILVSLYLDNFFFLNSCNLRTTSMVNSSKCSRTYMWITTLLRISTQCNTIQHLVAKLSNKNAKRKEIEATWTPNMKNTESDIRPLEGTCFSCLILI